MSSKKEMLRQKLIDIYSFFFHPVSVKVKKMKKY